MVRAVGRFGGNMLETAGLVARWSMASVRARSAEQSHGPCRAISAASLCAMGRPNPSRSTDNAAAACEASARALRRASRRLGVARADRPFSSCSRPIRARSTFGGVSGAPSSHTMRASHAARTAAVWNAAGGKLGLCVLG